MDREITTWGLEKSALVNWVERPVALQTDRSFEDGEVRVRFECQDASYLGFNIRLGKTAGFGVSWDRRKIVEMAGAERELIFSCRGEEVTATLDGKPLSVTEHSRNLSGTLHFGCVGGLLRIRSIDYREPK